MAENTRPVMTDVKYQELPQGDQQLQGRERVFAQDALAAFERTAEQARTQFMATPGMQDRANQMAAAFEIKLGQLAPSTDLGSLALAAQHQQEQKIHVDARQQQAAQDFLRFFSQQITGADEMQLIAQLKESAKTSPALDEATQKARLAQISTLEQALTQQMTAEQEELKKQLGQTADIDGAEARKKAMAALIAQQDALRERQNLLVSMATTARTQAEQVLADLKSAREADKKEIERNTLIANLTAASLGLLAASLSINEGILNAMGGPSVASADKELNIAIGCFFVSTGALEMIKAISEITYLKKNWDKMDNWQRASKIASITASMEAVVGCIGAACKHLGNISDFGAKYAGPVVFPMVFALAAASQALNFCHAIKDYLHGKGNWKNLALAGAQLANSMLSLGGVLYSGGMLATGPVGWAILTLTIALGFLCKYAEKRLKAKTTPEYNTQRQADAAAVELTQVQKEKANPPEEEKVNSSQFASSL